MPCHQIFHQCRWQYTTASARYHANPNPIPRRQIHYPGYCWYATAQIRWCTPNIAATAKFDAEAAVATAATDSDAAATDAALPVHIIHHRGFHGSLGTNCRHCCKSEKWTGRAGNKTKKYRWQWPTYSSCSLVQWFKYLVYLYVASRKFVSRVVISIWGGWWV